MRTLRLRQTRWLSRMGRILTHVTIVNALDPAREIGCEALVDTGAWGLMLPRAWKERLGAFQMTRTVEVVPADVHPLSSLRRAEIEVYTSSVQMVKSISIVDARRDLGRIADEVRRTGQAVVLTRRGRPVARLAPHPPSPAKPAGPERPLAGPPRSVQLLCTPDELLQTIRELRHEFAVSLERRSARLERSPRPRRA